MKRQTVQQWDAGYVPVSTAMQVERDPRRERAEATPALERQALLPDL